MPSIVHLIHVYGLVAVAAVVGLECVGLPLPGETALIAAAIYAGSKHGLNIYAVILTAGAAATLGRMIGYLLGREFGYRLLLRYGSYVGINEARIKLGQYLFLRHGGKIIVVSQFVPFLRTFAGIFAGANRMPWHGFAATNAVGSFVWAVVFGIAAYSLGKQFMRLAGSAVVALGAVFVILFIAFAIFIGRHEAQLTAEAERAMPGPLRLP